MQVVKRDAGSLYVALAPAVLGYLRAQGANEPEDLLHDVFLQVARDLPAFKGDDAKLRSWVFSIAHNRLIDDRRRRAVRPPRSSSPVPDRGYHDRRMEPKDEALIEACAALTDDQREVVVLRFVGDLALDEVARLTGRRVTAVKRLQARGLARLAELLAD
ncbi:MAG TPA: sigma-70 family RNA polymerase sigma factor [Acidimicrobiales bacterium]|nr:sigma-70 family RNA polymerase sigma factor [Acidimicrobiales bacterium]